MQPHFSLGDRWDSNPQTAVLTRTPYFASVKPFGRLSGAAPDPSAPQAEVLTVTP